MRTLIVGVHVYL